MSDVTHLLDAAADGELLPLVSAELRSLAATRMAVERPDHTLDATARVHEANLRLVGRARQRVHRGTKARRTQVDSSPPVQIRIRSTSSRVISSA